MFNQDVYDTFVSHVKRITYLIDFEPAIKLKTDTVFYRPVIEFMFLSFTHISFELVR